jgi:hypothetical protein
MGWATHYIAQLREGATIQFRPRGNSMTGKISSGQLVTVEPVAGVLPVKGDIVLCKINGAEYLHLVTAVSAGRYQISNNRGRINGWTTLSNIYGKCIKVEA